MNLVLAFLYVFTYKMYATHHLRTVYVSSSQCNEANNGLTSDYPVIHISRVAIRIEKFLYKSKCLMLDFAKIYYVLLSIPMVIL